MRRSPGFLLLALGRGSVHCASQLRLVDRFIKHFFVIANDGLHVGNDLFCLRDDLIFYERGKVRHIFRTSHKGATISFHKDIDKGVAKIVKRGIEILPPLREDFTVDCAFFFSRIAFGCAITGDDMVDMIIEHLMFALNAGSFLTAQKAYFRCLNSSLSSQTEDARDYFIFQ